MSGPKRTLPAPLVLTVIGAGAFVTALDQTVVVTALPSVMFDLRIPATADGLERASWIITAYLLGYTAIMPLVGRLGDVYGYSRVYRASLVVFSIGTVLVALSSSLEWMVGSRVVQAVGGGATVPIGLAIASTALTPRQRGLALGIVIAAAETGSMLGPAYGGAIMELADWRWIFWLNVPQSVVLFAAMLWLPNQPRTQPGGVDYLGGALLTAALVVLSVALATKGLFTLASPTPFVILVPGLTLVVVLAVVERRSWQPLLSPLLFHSRAFVTANLVQFMEGAALVIAMVTVPLMAGTVMGKDPFTGAMWLLRMTVAIPLGALVGGKLLGMIGIRPVAVAGLALAALGLFLASTWELDVAEPWLTVTLVTAGLGFGLNNTPIMTRALSAASEGYQATAASLVMVSRMVGMALGLAALSAWGVEHFQVLTVGLETPLPEPGEAVEALRARYDAYNGQLIDAGLSLFHNFFRVAGGVALIAILPALAMGADERE